MAVFYIGFGSNIGDREKNIIRALAFWAANESTQIVKISGLYETQPVGYLNQADFLNGVVCVETTKTTLELLAICLQIEQKLARTRTIRWGPRSIDLDVLLYDDVVLKSSELTLPHKELGNRLFVLQPLAEIAADVIVPDSKKTISRLLQETSDISRIRLVRESTELLSMIEKV